MKGRTSPRKRPPFGRRLASARTEQGLTQASLAAKLGVDRTTIRHYERSVFDPKLGFVLRCCKALHVSIESLIGRTVLPQPSQSGALRRFNERLLQLSPRRQQFALRLFGRQLVEIMKEEKR